VHHHLIKTNPTIQIDCVTAGDPEHPTILFLHGLAMTLDCFTTQVDYFSPHYHIVALSLRGHGQSTAPPTPTADDFSLEIIVQDVIHVLGHLNIEKAHIVGHSTGGVVGYALLKHAPERVASLTTFGTTAELNSGFLGNLVVLLDQLLGPKMEGFLAKQTVSKQKEVAAYVGQMIADTPKSTIVYTRKNLLNYSYLQTITDHPNHPILLIQSEFDSEINQVLASTLESLSRHPTAEVIQLNAAGHMANLDQPEKFNKILDAFLQKI